MLPRPPRSTRTYTLVPDTTLFRSVTGGAGYIGSTTAKALEQAGHTPVILDSLLTGPRAFVDDRIFYQGDIADRPLLRRIVEEHPDIECTIHMRSEEHTSELQSLMRISYAVFCLKKKKKKTTQ